MAEQRQIISKEELDQQLRNRISLEYSYSDRIIRSKEINYPIQLQHRIRHNPGTYIVSLLFSNCVFNEDVDIGSYENAGSIEFKNCTFNKSISIDFANVAFSGDCIFNGNLIIKLTQQDSVDISGLIVHGTFKVLGSARQIIIRNINHEQPKADREVIIAADSNNILAREIVGKSVRISSDVNSGTLELKRIIATELSIGSSILNGQMTVMECIVEKFAIINFDGDPGSLVISDPNINQMHFPIGALKRASITGGTINDLELSGSNEAGYILDIEKTTINNLRFEKVFNNGLLTLRELSVLYGGLVSIKSSNLGKTDFIYCNFSKAVLEFENSKVTEAFFSETEFPKRVLIGGKKNYGQAQLAFGQLATAFQKQGDNIRALEYTSREVDAHYRAIRWFSRNFFQKLNLWLNAVSNNFGRDWVRGVIFSFGVGLLFFCLLLISTDKYSWGLPTFDLNMLPAYLKFMNPLRFFELETLFRNTPAADTLTLNEYSYLADFGGRVFVAYGYYQTIQAFRRFGRK
ncbi:MAG TPA: hypothetical protein VD993_00885 [Chitinophagaceae bacterium]|nr:hypothetical protein [Chitinophagaceae bacterium]